MYKERKLWDQGLKDNNTITFSSDVAEAEERLEPEYADHDERRGISTSRNFLGFVQGFPVFKGANYLIWTKKQMNRGTNKQTVLLTYLAFACLLIMSIHTTYVLAYSLAYILVYFLTYVQL